MEFNLLNWQNPNPQLTGLLGPYYDPAEARKQALWGALTQAGLGLLSQGPSKTPIGFGDTLAAGFKGGIEGAQQGQQDYMRQGLLAQQMADQQKDRAWTNTERQHQLEEWGKPDPTARALTPEELDTYSKYGYADPSGTVHLPGGGPNDPGAEYGLMPIVTQDAQGKYHLFQANKGGGPPKEIPLPYGWTPKQQYLDLGTSMQAVPQVGIGNGVNLPVDNAGAARDKAIGAGQGEAATHYSSLASKYPGLARVVDDLDKLADEATYTQVGQAYNYARKELDLAPTDAAVARAKYIAMVDNQVLPMLRDTFGAQFTVVEGETLRATLGDPNKTPAEKKAVLHAFIEQKARNIEAAGIQGGVIPQQQQPQQINPDTPDVTTMSDEQLEAIINGP